MNNKKLDAGISSPGMGEKVKGAMGALTHSLTSAGTGVALLITLTAQQVDAAMYLVTDLGGLGGGENYANGINDAGQVTGVANNVDGGRARPFYSDGSNRPI